MLHPEFYKNRFAGKTVIVTGGGTGIGKQIAKDLHAEGASVHILGRRLEKLEESRGEATCGEADPNGDRFFCHQCDISDQHRVNEVFDRVMRASGPVYGLVNNAAINPSRNDVLNTDLEDWTATMKVNLTGAFNCCKAAVEQMLARGGGSIVNISSVGGLNAFRTRTSYNVSKFGLIGLTESLSLDYAMQNIRVNAVCPGYVCTELTAPLFEKMGEENFEALVKAHAMNRLGRPEEISRAVLFLLSEEASFITGVALPVDGGYLLKG